MRGAQAVAHDVNEVTIDSTDAREATVRPRSSARHPGLDVSLTVRPFSEAGGALVRVCVAGASGPFRVYVYADGELVETCAPGQPANEFVCSALASGRHAVTARAIDAVGRWGGASVLYAERAILHVTSGSEASSRDRGVRCTPVPMESA